MLQALIIGYLFLVITVAIIQRRLLYVPTRISSSVADAIAVQNGFTPWRNASGEIIGWKMPAAATPTASVLIVHGNAGCAAERDYIAGPIHASASLDVHVLEYPGYGARNGSPSKVSMVAAAEEAFALLPSDKPRYVVSESIGAGVGGHLAKTYSAQIAGMTFFVPYHSLAWVAQRRMPFLPVWLLLRDRFEPAEDLKSYHGPVKVVVAAEDEVIPAEAGRRLYAAYAGPKDLQVVNGARHNEVAEQSQEWWREVFAFWAQNKQPE